MEGRRGTDWKENRHTGEGEEIREKMGHSGFRTHRVLHDECEKAQG